MAKLKSSAKSKRTSASSSNKVEQVSRSIVDSAQHIWLAGMGAFGRAQEEGGKLFESLVREGQTLENRTRKLATGRVDAVRDVVENRVGQVRDRATDTWDRLEKVFEERVQRALNGLGVPGRKEIQALTERVDTLTREVRKLGSSTKPTAPRKTAAAKKGTARKSAGKKAAAKKSPARKSARKKSAKTS